ncbi:MAG: translation initiation factor IF-2 [Candidatus Diapherotrites archaeon]|nr:translation initiation factor IF-2 [Candidatus Diapherotrites archaeon]
MAIRQPIITVAGHVDCGKTTCLDRIRGSHVAAKEAGLITQHIGATEVPKEIIENICKDLIEKTKIQVKVPGLLFIDTPGHQAFTALRKRGGSIADMAIVLIDIMEGIKQQTLEAIEILKTYKTPFIIGLNQIDRFENWQSTENGSITDGINKQDQYVQAALDKRVYEIVGELYNLGFQSELYNRLEDFTKQIMIIPMSAKTGEGIPEMLMYLTGLSQKFLGDALETEVSGPGKGTILEVKDEIGFGKTVDVILYDGIIKVGDTIVVGGMNGAFDTKIRALLKPKPLEEIRAPNEKFKSVSEVTAAAGLKIAAPGLEDALAGAPIYVTTEIEETKTKIEAELEKIQISTDSKGIVIKADALGSLEALVKMLSEKGIPIRSGKVGTVNKMDITEAVSVKEADKYLGVIFAFNVKIEDTAREAAKADDVKIFEAEIIYSLLEKYEIWAKEQKEIDRKAGMKDLVLPGKIQIIPGCLFRNTKPAIVGVKVLAGSIRPDYPLMKESGEFSGEIKSIKSNEDILTELNKGGEAAISIREPIVVGRHIFENDILYTRIPRDHIFKIKSDYAKFLTKEELELLDEIAEIVRKNRGLV